MQQLACSQEQWEGLAAVLTHEQLAASAQERAASTELAGGTLQLLEGAEAAIDSGEPEGIVLALVNAFRGLAVQLRELVLDEAVASIPAPDRWPT
ncbi:hypothetical protein [Streptomyces sp. NPDC054838]